MEWDWSFHKTESKMKYYFMLVYSVIRFYVWKPLADSSAACEAPMNYEQSSPVILDAVKKLMEHCHEMNVWLKHHRSSMWLQISFMGFFKAMQVMFFCL